VKGGALPAGMPALTKGLSDQAERALLGAIITSPGVLAHAMAELREDDFMQPRHAATYRLLVDMHRAARGIDLITVCQAAAMDNPDRFGGLSYLAELPEHCPSAVAAPGWITAIAEQSRVMRLRTLAYALLEDSYTDIGIHRTAAELADTYAPRLAELGASRATRKHLVSLEDALTKVEEDRLDREAGVTHPALSTGFAELDKLIAGGGMQPGQLIVIGGRPGMGKSALAQAITMSVASDGFSTVLYASMEMRSEQLAPRLAAVELGIPSESIRLGELDADDAAAFARFETKLRGKERRVWIFDKPTQSIETIAAEARALWAKGGLRLVVIDHLHLMNHPRRDRRDLEIGATTQLAKQLAGELGVTVLLLSQLNREASRRDAPKRSATGGPWWNQVAMPRVEDLKESGSIEADADLVLFPLHASECGIPSMPTGGAIHIAKQRDGAKGVTVGVAWDGPCGTYRPWVDPLYKPALKPRT
jgi:replicative DNA helicase